MADLIDREAAVSSDDEDMESNGSRGSGSGDSEPEDSEDIRQEKSPGKKKKSTVISSDESEEDEEEDEEKARQEMKGFIADEDEEEESDGDGGRTSRGSRHRHHRRRRSRSRSRSDVDDEIDEDDMELLQENLGIKIKKQRKRIKMDASDDDDDDNEPSSPGRDSRAGSRVNDELPDIDTAPAGEGGDGSGYESEDVNDFIVDEDGQPIKRDRKKKKQHLFNDSARQNAEDIFGVAFDYDEFEQYGEEDYESEDEDDEDEERPRKRKQTKKKQAKTIFELYEPRELELRHFTDQDNDIRNTDIPERMQLRSTPVTSVPEDKIEELDREAAWIFKHGFTKPTISKQVDHTRADADEWLAKPAPVEKIRKALDFMRQQFHEVPFIAFYRKEYVEPELKINDLWRVYQMDELWCKLTKRKGALYKLVKKMQDYQGDMIMQNPDAPLPEDYKMISAEDLQRIADIESFEELKDRDQHFKLYYGKDIEIMQEAERAKRREQREARKMRKKTKKRKTKTITNEEGEEIEVTDEEAESEAEEDEPEDDEPEEEEDDKLKKAKGNDPYNLCKKFGLLGFGAKFGLTPEQYGDNLNDGYQRHDTEQESGDPLEVAAEFKSERMSDPQEIVNAGKFLVATQIARDPTVRRFTREQFMNRATITITPTKKGVKDIDESHDIYSMKYVKNKPVRDLEGERWLLLTAAEEQGLITIDIGSNLHGNAPGRSFLEEAKEYFYHDAFHKSVQEWNTLRGKTVELAFEKMVFPMLRKELRLQLTREAKEGILDACRKKLYDWIKVGRYQVSFEDEDEDDWDSSAGCRVMAIMYESDINVSAYAVSLTTEGEVGGLLKLDHILKRKNAFREKEAREKQSDLDALASFIQSKKPHCVVVGCADRNAISIQRDVEDVISELVEGEAQFPKIKVFLMDDNLSKVYANSTKAEQDFREYPNVLRQAVSLARRMQDPLCEFSQLTGPENEITCLRYHPLQDLVTHEELLEALNIEFINRTNEVGVDINECVNHQFMSNLVQFVGGLGPRKAAALLKTLRQMQSSQRLENRQQLVTMCHMGPKVLINCAGFIKIDTSSLGDSEVYVEVLDGSRIHNEAYEWARKMAVDALEYDEEEGNPANALEEILQEPDKLAELDLEAFAQELERQGFGKKSITLQDIRSELYSMYKDLREPYAPPEAEEVFNMVTKETPQTFYVGKLVQAAIYQFAYKKPQGEELDQAAPLKVQGDENHWQCPFCGQADFPELTEVWNHFDAGNCPGKAVGVKVRLDNGVTGFISMKNLSDSNVLNPEDRVRIGQNIYCRILKIQPDRFSVECASKSSVLRDDEHQYKPALDDYYDKDAEAKEREKDDKKKEQKARQTYIKRVIVHPSFYNIAFKEAEKLMHDMDQGDVIIRPSSKGEDRLTVTWKVHDGIYQHIEVREEGKENAFSLGQSLWIGNEEFEDLDEIIARHINPMASHARDVLAFKYYRETDGGKREKAEEMLRNDKRAQANKIHYFLSASKQLPGKFMLSYLPRTKARHEFVTVTPDGFRFRSQVFDSLSSLMKWFKEHFRDPIPGTPVTPSGGRNTSRTPYNMTGTPGGGITPGAMSLATGTPYGTTPGSTFAAGVTTPYTPSGQTPFMTPYNNTPGPSGQTPRVGGAPHRSGANTPRAGYTTPGGTRQPPLPRQGMPPPPSGGYTPGRGPPHGTPSGSGQSRRPAPYPSPGNPYGSYGSRNQSPAGGRARDPDSWQAAADSWARGGRKTPANTTPRGYTGSTTPRMEDANRTPRYDGGSGTSRGGERTPRTGSGKRTPKNTGDATPLYDE